MSSSITSFLACLALAAGVAPAAFAERQFSDVAPAAKSRIAPEALSAGVAPSAHIVLDALPASQLNTLREKNSRNPDAAIQVGVVRDVPATQIVRSTQLEWKTVEGGHAAQWRVSATDAKALRVALDVRHAQGVVARFASIDGHEIHSQALSATGLTWSPLIGGGAALVELFAPSAVDVRDIDVSLARIADHFANPALPDAIAKSQWLAQPCEVDLVCEAQWDPVLARAGSASIKLNWIDGYTAYACSGTLLNPADGSFRPYVYTAAHCLGTQRAADSLVSVWFYEKSSCGGEDARPAVQVAGGAQLLVADETTDAALLRLNRMPPEGAVYAGWDSDAPPVGESLVALHHANGEVTKVSHGTVVAPPPYPQFAIAWTSGIVQGGSSGSGAFSRVASPRADLLMRGGLSSANASCSSPGVGYYSRLDQVWPLMAPYLSASPKYANATGLWSDAAEPGWGVTLEQQGDVVFAVLFTYADDGRASWLVASGLRANAQGMYSGALYRTSRGGVAEAGHMHVTLASANQAKLEYTIAGRAVAKTITRQVFAGAAPVCTSTKASRASATSMQDLWFDPADPGWGIGIAHQGDTLFATLFTYDEAGNPTWLVASSVTRDAEGAYAGTLYRTSVANAGPVKATAAGSLRLAFNDGENALATMTVDGRTSVRPITRQVFGSTLPVCR